jgi:hypothetical protein
MNTLWVTPALIPLRNPLTGKKLAAARFTAVPFDLPANQTHGFWVDLYVPSNAVSGEYCGVYRLAAAAGRTREIPVALAVWDFILPLTPTLVTAFGSPTINTEDVMPRLLSLCGLPIPESVEGFDFTGAMRGGPDPSGGATVVRCMVPFGEFTCKQGGREYRAVRTAH